VSLVGITLFELADLSKKSKPSEQEKHYQVDEIRIN